MVGKTVYIEGHATSLALSESATTIVNNTNAIPSAYRPSHVIFCYGHAPGARIARFWIDTTGEIDVDGTRNLSDGSAYTTAAWHQFRTSYMID